MGLQNREGGNFISIYAGKFAQRVQEGTEGAMQRTNKLGKVVFEKFYDSFTGKLVSVTTKDGEYGKQWNFTFKDQLDAYTLSLAYSNSYAKAFLKMLPNIDLTKEMYVSPQQKEVDGKQKSSLFVKQEGKWITQAYTRENPNGLPEMKLIKVKGVDTWDDTEQLAFLEEMVNTKIVPNLPKDTGSSTTQAGEKAGGLNEFAADLKGENADDLGF